MNDNRDLRGSLFEDEVEEEIRTSPELEVSEDGMEAYINIPKKPLSVDVRELLEELDINFGIDNDLVTTITKNLYDGIPIEPRYLIAKGKKPVFGQPGEMILRTKKPEEDIISSEDLAKVDYKTYKRKLLALGEKERPIAMIISPTKGHDGMNIYGRAIPGEDGEEVLLNLGENVYQSGRKLISRIDGLVQYRKNNDGIIEMDVSEVYMVNGDVDYNTGNVDFPGSVIVKGIIKAGFEVKAKNEVVADTIRGNVIAGGSVVAKQGIIGGTHKAEISAGGTVYAKFVQNAKIVTDDSVIVKKSILMSEIYSEGQVLVDGSPGTIIGGSIFAVEGVEAKVFGSESFVKTEVALYKSAKDVILMREVIARRFQVSKDLLRIETYLGDNRKVLFKEMHGDKQELIRKLMKKRDELRRELLEKNTELKTIQKNLITPLPGTIIVGREAWPEVRVSISGKFILLKTERSKGHFYYNVEMENIDFK